MTKRNFEKLTCGSWYQLRNGSIRQIEEGRIGYPHIEGRIYSDDGFWYCNGADSPFDVILEIEPPVIVPKKRKVTKVIQGFLSLDAVHCENIVFKKATEGLFIKFLTPATLTIECEE